MAAQKLTFSWLRSAVFIAILLIAISPPFLQHTVANAIPFSSLIKTEYPLKVDTSDRHINAFTSLSNTGRITGTVTGPDGILPLGSIEIRAYRYNGVYWVTAGSTLTGINGTYSLTGLPATTFRIRFSDPTGTYVTEYFNDQRDASPDPANLITLFEGEVRGNIDASLALAGYIVGTVTKVSGGDPVEDFVAGAYQYRSGKWRIDGSGVTDGNGDYEIRGLTPGSYIIYFSDPYTPPRYLEEFYDNVLTSAEATYVPVTAGVTTPNIDADLGSYGSIAGTVTGPLGSRLADITANIWQYNSSLAQWELLGGTATDENGDFSVPGLVTRDYRVEFFDSKGQYGTEYHNNKTTVETGDNVHVELGYETSNIDAALALAPDTVDLDLVQDWNLISIPVVQEDPAIETTLQTITSTYEVAWAYDGCVPEWLKYDPNDPLSSLTVISTTQGMWIDQAIAATLTVTGTHPLATQIALCAGWNLIGYPSVTPKPVAEVLAPIKGKFNLVYAYDAFDVSDPWKVYDPDFPEFSNLSTMQAWQGYWILMNQSATLTIQGR
ncbi:MAG: hypothetical protein P1S60_08350 [Anaerolineae bacterium]|nr:hypothetical protein [Anaerolineae bacterium]